MKLQQVHLRINDAATGQPTPVRLRITDADGNYYAPYGRLTEFATGVNQDVGGNVMIGTKKWAYIDGACEILLPPGTLHIEVTKGPEYTPIDQDIQLLAGKMSLRFTIERWSDVRKQGWYSGDTRVHFLSPDAALLEGQAEDVAVVNLLAVDTGLEAQSTERLLQTDLAPESWSRFRGLIDRAMKGDLTDGEKTDLRVYADTGALFTGIKESAARRKPTRAIPEIISFSGQSFSRQTNEIGVAVNTLNRNLDLGSLGLLHCHRVVYPLYADERAEPQEWTLHDWCGQCHRKKGLAVWTNSLGLVRPSTFGEPLADLILGEIDAFEISDDAGVNAGHLAMYDTLCKAGLVVPLVAAAGKQSNREVIGGLRTYALLSFGHALTYSSWIEAVRAGRTFVSNGPLLHFTIDGDIQPKALDVCRNGKSLQVRAEAKSADRFDRLELLWNGAVIAAAVPTMDTPFTAMIEHDLHPRESGWFAARCITDKRGEADFLPLAHSSAVTIRLAEAPHWAMPEVVNRLLGELDAMLRWAHEQSCKSRLINVLEEARTILAKKLS